MSSWLAIWVGIYQPWKLELYKLFFQISCQLQQQALKIKLENIFSEIANSIRTKSKCISYEVDEKSTKVIILEKIMWSKMT